MSIQMLKEQIREFGVANAIVVLNPKKVEVQESFKLAAEAVRSRQIPPVVRDLLSELSKSFHSGGIAQRRAVISDMRETVQASLASISKSRAPASQPEHSAMLHFPRLGIIYGALDREGLRALEAHDAVDIINHAPQLSLIQPEKAVGKTVNRSDAEIGWGLKRMHAPELWEKGYTGSDIVIAHLDTGVDSQHPALQKAVVHSMVFDLHGEKASPEGLFEDTGSHGTHTAGTIAGRNEGSGPVIGMAPGASLACGTVITGGDTVARVLGGMDWALETGARILNMSLGFRGWNGSFEPVMQILRANQLIPIIAIGNEGAGTSRSPGNYGTALSVGAVDEYDKVWALSSSQHGGRSKGPLICAPGVEVLSAKPGGKYKTQSGTSMAAPHIAGLAALLLNAVPSATIDQLQEALLASCENPAGADGTRIGSGIPNGLTALKILSSM